ncbi:MAG TPA: phosphatidylglycerophosphatase A, partial [Burkholderiaceae bacterium]|nr:phosphatidylglycerophosphatase A [Burkholderiaceae bacterium]
GTWGSLMAWALFVLLDPWLSDGLWALVIALCFALGAWTAHETGRELGQPDSGHIVIDEIVALWLVLWWLPDTLTWPFAWQAAAFGLFRCFDIGKPPPIRFFDARFKHGLGVMLDDLWAAFYTCLLLALATVFFH